MRKTHWIMWKFQTVNKIKQLSLKTAKQKALHLKSSAGIIKIVKKIKHIMLDIFIQASDRMRWRGST